MNSETCNPAGVDTNTRCEAANGLRFAVLCTDMNWQPWQRRSVELLEVRECGQLAAVIRVADGALVADPIENVINGLGVRLGRGSWQLNEECVARIRALNLDFILVFGMERLHGDVLEAARHGAWSFPGFGECADEEAGVIVRPIVKDEPLTELAFVRLAPAVGEDVVLKRAILRTPRTARENFALATSVMSEWPASVAAMLIAECPLPGERLSGSDWNSAVEPPTSRPASSPVAREFMQWVRTKFESLFTFDQWHVGIARTDFKDVLERGLPSDISWATPLPRLGAFYADPIGLEVDTGLRVFCECYDHWSGKGDIRALSYSPAAGWGWRAERVIDEPFHLSYPYITDMGGSRVCIPECCEAGVAYAYPVSADGEIKVEERSVFLEFEIADPTPVEHNGYWYLFGASAKEAQYALRIWFAKSLDGPWSPHPANPVKCDVQTARPAGPMVRLNGKLYRPSQDSTKSYGSAANIMEIVELSPTSFKEVCARKIEPDARWPYPDGIHTLTTTRDGILIDAKAIRISLVAPLLRVANFIGVRRRRRRLAQRQSL